MRLLQEHLHLYFCKLSLRMKTLLTAPVSPQSQSRERTRWTPTSNLSNRAKYFWHLSVVAAAPALEADCGKAWGFVAGEKLVGAFGRLPTALGCSTRLYTFPVLFYPLPMKGFSRSAIDWNEVFWGSLLIEVVTEKCWNLHKLQQL